MIGKICSLFVAQGPVLSLSTFSVTSNIYSCQFSLSVYTHVLFNKLLEMFGDCWRIKVDSLNTVRHVREASQYIFLVQGSYAVALLSEQIQKIVLKLKQLYSSTSSYLKTVSIFYSPTTSPNSCLHIECILHIFYFNYIKYKQAIAWNEWCKRRLRRIRVYLPRLYFHIEPVFKLR